MRNGIVTVQDGRSVGFADYGDPGQTAVIWCHGGPGCRREPEYFASAAGNAGLRLIGIDRPGYGRSTPQPGRTIAGWVGDALTVADELDLGQFATVGVSTGGAYALALAALTPRVIATVACCAVTDMRWPEGKAMMTGPEAVWRAPSREAACAVVTDQLGADGSKISVDVLPLAPSDAQMFAEPGWARMWSETIPEWFAHGVVGYTDDRLADGGGWHTFDVRRITCPVVVLHGASDTLAPVAHASYTQRLVAGSTLDIRDGLGHFSILPEVVPALRGLLDRVGKSSARTAHAR
jgi:pimeloyl-ACP methyl ester carboxylesterase